MSVPVSARSARAELAAVAAGRGSDLDRSALRSLPRAPGSRRAAVLMLFGVLDDLPSDHDAHDAAVSADLDVLLLARATTLSSHAGQIAFPGGRVDPGDTGPVDAALREAREETGLDPAGVDVLGVLEEVPLAYSRHLVRPVLGWWRNPSPVRVVDERESSDVFRVPVADLLDAERRGTVSMRREGQSWRGPAFVVPHADGEHLVWGFTAMLLDRLFDRLGWTEPWDQDREFPLTLPG
ncbi:MAG: coenzyme A pyrophosphatase [Microbacterium sp.]|nr:coenzyme A pyrophosphatase [Microbacterium sp.]